MTVRTCGFQSHSSRSSAAPITPIFFRTRMFRNKILVRANFPFQYLYPFPLLQLCLSYSSSSSSIEIETLCWKLSRRWRLACFHASPFSVFVIYQRSQAEAAARVVEELAKTQAVCNVGEEEEVRSSILIARAVDCWFRSLMLEKGWRCIGDSTFVDSTFTGDEEKKYSHAVNVRIQSEIDGLVFIVSPDVIWFIRDKITDLVASRDLQCLHDGNVALVEKDGLLTACIALPSLYIGHILGLSKLTPVGEKFELLEELWKFKHGLTLSSDYYVNVHFSHGGQASKHWSSFLRRSALLQTFTFVIFLSILVFLYSFVYLISVIYRLPSAFVLRGSGLCPAPQTVRSSMAVNAFNSFINTIRCSDFFSQGPLKVKEVTSLETPMMQPSRKMVGTASNDNKSVTSATEECRTFQNLHLTLDFRTPKPALGFISANRMLDYDNNHSDSVLTSHGTTETTTTCAFRPPIPKPLNEVVQMTTKLWSLSQSQTHLRESSYRNDAINFVKPASVASNAREESGLRQRNVDNLHCSSKDVGDKRMNNTLNNNLSSKDKKVEKNAAFSKRTPDNENKNKEGKSEASMKMKTKLHADSSDVNWKVIDFHARGKLQSLTISDLKCFLASKKMKVGGKKEELIQRVATMLG